MSEMTEDYTQLWKDGKLEEGYYYVQCGNDVEIDYYHVFGDNRYWNANDDDTLDKIISPAPTYQEYLESESHCAVYSVVNKQLKEKNGKIISANKRLAKENAHLKDLLRKARGYLCDYTTDIGLLAEIEKVIEQ